MLEKTLESPLDCKKIKPVNPKGNQFWILIRRTDAKAETPILWPPDVKSRLNGKDPDAGKDWEQEKKGTAEDETVVWHHRLNGQECEQTPGDSGGQRRLALLQPWSYKELRHNLATEQQQISKQSPLLLTASIISLIFPIPLLFLGSLMGQQGVRTQSTFTMVTFFVPLEIRLNHKPYKYLGCTKTTLN